MKRNPSVKKYEPYGNYKIYHPDGFLMFYCSVRRYNWYLKQSLSKPYLDGAILLFTPKGTGEDQNILNEQRGNLCVKSGVNYDLTVHHVVPYQYRKELPLIYKDKNSNDVVVLTESIHREYERIAFYLKGDLLKEYITPEEHDYNTRLIRVQKNIKTIAEHSDKIPADFLWSLEHSLVEFAYDFDIELDEIPDLQRFNFSKLIVDRYGHEDFIVMWKNHFVDTVQPEYLPSWWNPNTVYKKQ